MRTEGTTDISNAALMSERMHAEKASARPKAKTADFQTRLAQTDTVEVETPSEMLGDRPGRALGIQKMIDSGRYVSAAPNSRVGAALAQAGITAPEVVTEPDGGVIEDPADGKSPLLYSTADVESLNAAYRTSEGDDGFIAELDLNTDGTIDGADLAQLLSLIGQAKPESATAATDSDTYTEADIEALRVAWGAVQEGARDGARLDFNADGMIDGADLASLLSILNGSGETPQHDGGIVEETPIAPDEPTIVTAEPSDPLVSDKAIATDPLAELRSALTESLLSTTVDTSEALLAELLAP